MKLAAIEQIAQAFARHRVRFLVVGGLAVAAHGHIRFTADLDLVIQLDPANVEHAFAALEEIGYKPNVPVTGRQFGDPQLREKWIAEKGMVVLNFWSDRYRDTPVDVFVSEPFDFDGEFETGLQQELVPGVLFHFPRLETLIEMKLRAGRPKDLNDVDALRKSQSA